MNILVIVGNYYPNPSSVAVCVRPLVESLVHDGHNVSLVTNNRVTKRNKVETIDKIKMYSLVDTFAVSKLSVNNFYDNSHLPHKLKMLLRKVSKIPLYFFFGLYGKEKNMGGWSIKKSTELCISLHKKEKFDLLLSFSLPFTAHLIALNLKKYIAPSIPWILYEYDPYAYNYNFKKQLINIIMMKKQEHEVFSLVDSILLTPELYSFYPNTVFKKYIYKMAPLHYASIKPVENSPTLKTSNISYDRDEIVCVYAGRLYMDIRNPMNMIDFFKRIKAKVKLYLFTDYSQKVFRNAIEDNLVRFELLERIEHESVLHRMKHAHILISIGNTVETQVPGKIFEYMSLGKPIVHFSKIKNDPSLLYLQLYPMCLVINEYEVITAEKIKEFEIFIEKYKDTSLEFEEVKRYMAGLDKDSVVKEFLSVVNSYN